MNSISSSGVMPTPPEKDKASSVGWTPAGEDDGEAFFIVCDCHDFEHTMVFSHYPWEQDEEWYMMYVSMHIAPTTPFFHRAWKALKYVAKGEKIPYGHWHEILIKPKRAKKLASFLNKFADGEVA